MSEQDAACIPVGVLREHKPVYSYDDFLIGCLHCVWTPSLDGGDPYTQYLAHLVALAQAAGTAPMGVGERAFQEHVVTPDEAAWLRGWRTTAQGTAGADHTHSHGWHDVVGGPTAQGTAADRKGEYAGKLPHPQTAPPPARHEQRTAGALPAAVVALLAALDQHYYVGSDFDTVTELFRANCACGWESAWLADPSEDAACPNSSYQAAPHACALHVQDVVKTLLASRPDAEGQ